MEDSNNSTQYGVKYEAVESSDGVKSSGVLNVLPVNTEDTLLPVHTQSADEFMCPLTEEEWPSWIPDEQSDDNFETSHDMKKNNDINNVQLGVKQMDSRPLTLEAALERQTVIIRDVWPNVSESAEKDQMEYLNIYQRIKITNAPNFAIAKIQVPSNLIIREWEKRLEKLHDTALCEYLKYGWLIGYHLHHPPATLDRNHPSA